MKKVIAVALFVVCALVLLAVLSAHGDPTITNRIGNGDFSEVQIPLKDGRVITCIRDMSRGGGISCDWTGEQS